MTASRHRWVWVLLIWVAAFAIALALDRVTAQTVAKFHPLDKQGWIARTLKLPGWFPFTLVIAVLVGIFHRKSWRIALPLVLSGPLVGLAYTLLKWVVGRRRPVLALEPFTFHPFARGVVGLVHAESGLSFPSGHTALAFATATCLARAFPRWGKVFFLAAACVGAERILENAHYLSDVVAGAGVGIICGWGAMRLCSQVYHAQPSPVPSPSGRGLG